MRRARQRWRGVGVVCVVMLSWAAGGCAHSRGPGPSRFVRGNVPDYEAAWRELNRPPDESRSDFIERVKRLAAEARAPRSVLPSIEATDPVLKAALLALSVAPTAVAHWRVGESYRRVGVSDMAYSHFRDAVEIDGRCARAWDGLARVWRDWGHLGRALGDAHRALYIDPSNPVYRNTLGTVLHGLGLPREARSSFERALELAPGAPWALSNLCLVAIHEGRREDAIAYCEQAVAVQPSASIARANLRRAHGLRAATPLTVQ